MRRREFIKGTLVAAALPGIPVESRKSREFHLFAKSFQQMGASELAEFAAKAGFAGIDLPVRPNGFVKPERVREDLPAVIEAFRKQGLVCEMIVTNINSPETPHAENVLKTARDCGAKVYRMGYFEYEKGVPMAEAVDVVKRKFAAMEQLSRSCGMTAGYQNHSSYMGMVRYGGLVWDLWDAIKDLDPQYVSSQYDVMHALVETAASWSKSMGLIQSHIRSACLKDFYWVAPEKNPKDRMFFDCPAGDGLVPWRQYAEIIKHCGITVPMSIHCEFLSGKKETFEQVKREVDYFKRVLV